MKKTPFDLTTEQKDLLKSLSQETGKSISVLLAEALEGLRDHVRLGHLRNGKHGDKQQVEPPSKPIWDVADELFGDLSEDELNCLPPDGATQHDHYIYGTPKRPE
jgi:predicted DNA-binding protein